MWSGEEGGDTEGDGAERTPWPAAFGLPLPPPKLTTPDNSSNASKVVAPAFELTILYDLHTKSIFKKILMTSKHPMIVGCLFRAPDSANKQVFHVGSLKL